MKLIQIAQRGEDKTLADYLAGVRSVNVSRGEQVDRAVVEVQGTHRTYELHLSAAEARDLAASLVWAADNLEGK